VQRWLKLLADPTRVRILAAVEGEELGVNEIAQVLGMGQSRISNHLRLLRDAAALEGRREGTWTFYRNALAARPETRDLWQAVRRGLEADARVRADARRRRGVLERRRRRSRAHFDGGGRGAASFGFESGTLREEVLAALVPRDWAVLDAGCGDGFLTEVLKDRFARIVAVDHSPERLAEARRRVEGARVGFEQGELDALPLAAQSQDAVFLILVLHHVPEVGTALAEAFRVLRPGGRLVVADLAPHDEEVLRDRMGDLRLGLDPVDLAARLEAAGFVEVGTQPARDRLVLGRGRTLDLFLATGRRPAAARRTATKPPFQGSRT
jgi:ArsR family transcriptional regulator